MAALDRTWYNTLVNDDGSNTVGTPWTKEAVDAFMDAIDLAFLALGSAAVFTPTIGGSGGQSGQVYSLQNGRSMQLGRLAFVHGRITLSTLGTITGTVQIKGLPLAANGGGYSPAFFPFFAGLTTSVVSLGGYVAPSTSVITLQQMAAASTGTGNTAQGDLSNTTDLIYAAIYETDA